MRCFNARRGLPSVAPTSAPPPSWMQPGYIHRSVGVLNFSRPLLFFTEEWLCNIRLSHTRLCSNQAAEALPCSRYQATSLHGYTDTLRPLFCCTFPQRSPPLLRRTCLFQEATSQISCRDYLIFNFTSYLLFSGLLWFSSSSHLLLAGCSLPDKYYIFSSVHTFHSGSHHISPSFKDRTDIYDLEENKRQ